MVERQRIGYAVEHAEIANRSLRKATSYTDPFDAYTGDDFPVQVKAKCYGRRLSESSRTSVELGSFNRLPKDQDFELVIVVYNHADVAFQHLSFLIKAQDWNQLLENDALNYLSEDRVFDGILPRTVSKTNDQLWIRRRSSMAKHYRSAYPVMASAFRPRFKRDSRGQKRMQVAIRITSLYEVASRISDTSIYRQF